MADEKTNGGDLSVEYAALSDKRILIIEDDRFLHSLLSDKFSAANAEVISAYNGEDGLAEAQRQAPDLILLDILLPGRDGFEILKEMKADGALESVPVIILSNLGQEEDVRKGTELGAKEFLVKANFTLEEVLDKVSGLLGGNNKK